MANRTVTGTVANPAGVAQEGIRLYFTPLSSAFAEGAVIVRGRTSAVTDADGEFSVELLAGVRYEVVYDGPGILPRPFIVTVPDGTGDLTFDALDIADPANGEFGSGLTVSTPAIAGASSATAIAPNDSTDIPVTRGLYVGVGGDVAVLFADDSTAVTLKGLLAGVVYPLRVKRVRATGTTATNIVALR